MIAPRPESTRSGTLKSILRVFECAPANQYSIALCYSIPSRFMWSHCTVCSSMRCGKDRFEIGIEESVTAQKLFPEASGSLSRRAASNEAIAATAIRAECVRDGGFSRVRIHWITCFARLIVAVTCLFPSNKIYTQRWESETELHSLQDSRANTCHLRSMFYYTYCPISMA